MDFIHHDIYKYNIIYIIIPPPQKKMMISGYRIFADLSTFKFKNRILITFQNLMYF